jgi:hypothetical protein
MALHIRKNIVTLADFGLTQAARPVVARTKDIVRKREARREAREMKLREEKLTILCENGFRIRPIK